MSASRHFFAFACFNFQLEFKIHDVNRTRFWRPPIRNSEARNEFFIILAKAKNFFVQNGEQKC